MPIEFSLDAEKRRVHSTVTGTFTLHDILEGLKSVLEMPEFGPHFQVLSDHRGDGLLRRTGCELGLLACTLRSGAGLHRGAV